MPSQAEIQALIDQIQTGANYRANQMRPLLTNMLNFSTANQTVVFNNLVANNTTSATTLVLNVGVNIIVTSTLTDYACKLPQPVTGQKVTIINRGQRPIAVFPSNIGGQINLLPIDEPAIVPNDGAAYDFYCIENPLPGAWVWSPPAISQIDSGEISVSHTNGFPTNAFGWDANIGFSGFGAGVDGNGNLALTGGPWIGLTFPATVTRVKVYTNIVSSDVGLFIPDAITVQLITAYLQTANSSTVGPRFHQYLYGTSQFPEPGVLFSPTGTLNAPPEIGDTQTMYCIYDMPYHGINDQIGTGGPFSSFYYTFGMLIPATAVTKTYKFRFFLEYF